MKKNTLKITGLFLGTAFTAGISLTLLNNYKNANSVDAYSASDLPTTIDLNDTSENDIRSYYSSLNSKSTSERQGTNLLKNLKEILKTNQKYYRYDDDNAIWDIYCIVDRDWEHSPASALPSNAGIYNPSTNKITNYKWGNNSAKYENPYLHALYYNRDQTSIAKAYGDHRNGADNPAGINREHIWPKGAGFNTEGQGGARGDIMHLWAANGHTNNKHSNFYYGFVDKNRSYKDEGSSISICSGNLLGFSKTMGGNTSVFEPQDSDKGDIARACFYMVARYNYYSGYDGDGINTNNPNLELVNDLSSFSTGGYNSSTSKTGKLGIIQDLLEWNRIDPPDEFEIHRNNLCYTNFTNNRNPFIDYPEWAEYIWGKSVDGDYSSTSTGYATPTSDTINDFSGGESSEPTVKYVSVSPTVLNLDINGETTGNLVATVSVKNDAPQTVTWSSSNTSVATVSSDGVVTALATGTTTITATSTFDTTKYGTCSVSVTDSSQSGGTSTDFELYSGTLSEGDYVIYYSGKAMSNTVTSNRLSYSSIEPENNVISKPNDSIVWHIAPCGDYWTIYNEELELYVASTGTKNQAGMIESGTDDKSLWTVSGTQTYEFVNKFNDAGSINSNLRNNGTYGFACYSTSTGGALSLYKRSNGPEKTLTSIYLSEQQTNFTVGDEFAFEGTVTAIYSTGEENDVTDEAVFTGYDMSVIGNQTVTVSYTEDEITKTETYEIVVEEPVATSISAITYRTYYVGETISSDDIIVEDNLGNFINTFTFANDGYQFKYSDAASGGELTDKIFTNAISYNDLTCSLTVQVIRKEHGIPTTTDDTLTRENTGVTSTVYSSWDGVDGATGAVYAGHTAGGYESIQLRSTRTDDTYNSGIVTTTSGGNIRSISVTWYGGTGNGRKINIYGKNTGYSSPNDLFDTDKDVQGTFLGSIVKGVSTTLEIEGNYAYVGVRSYSGALYMLDITFTYDDKDTPSNIANYIMYEDTAGQCESKFAVAESYFNNLTKSGRAEFMTSDDYVISSARERFESWAAYLGKEIVYADGDYIIEGSRKVLSINNDETAAIIVVVVLSSLSLVGLFVLLVKRKRKYN